MDFERLKTDHIYFAEEIIGLKFNEFQKRFLELKTKPMIYRGRQNKTEFYSNFI